MLGSHSLRSRLIVGTGKYATFELMRECLEVSGSDVITVAVRRERLVDASGRSILDFIDLDKYTILPNTAGCFTADDAVADGFEVLCYTTDDPITARRLKEAGATSVMPAGSPIGSGQGILNPNNIRICLEYLKENDPDYPVIVDAGVGTASDVAFAMELGCDGVLLNTAIASATDPAAMAEAMKLACRAGWLASRAGRIPKKLYATASSPEMGLISPGAR